jgi:hypothetical protein
MFEYATAWKQVTLTIKTELICKFKTLLLNGFELLAVAENSVFFCTQQTKA